MKHITRKRAFGALALGVSATLILAGCSAEREGEGGSAAPAEDCVNAEAAQAEYQESWKAAADGFGIELEALEEEICEVDASKYAADPKQGDTYRIAFAAQGPTNSWGLLSDEALLHRADEIGVEVLYAAANGDATTQVDNIQQLSSQDPDAMVVVPMGEGIAGQVKAAADLGIPIVVCSGILPASAGHASTVTRQYDLMGSAYAEWIAATIDYKGEVALLSGLAGVPTAEYQLAAAKRTFEKYPDIDVVTTQYTMWSPTEAKTVAQNLIATYPNLAGIWSDSGYGAIGVIQAYQEAGLPIPPITGDAFNQVLMDTQGIDLKMALSTFPPEMSSTCLDTAVSLLKGEKVLDKVFINSLSFLGADAQQYLREDCDGALPVPSAAPQDLLVELGLCA